MIFMYLKCSCYVSSPMERMKKVTSPMEIMRKVTSPMERMRKYKVTNWGSVEYIFYNFLLR